MLNKWKTEVVSTEAPSLSAPTQEAYPHEPWSGVISHHLSEVQASQAQLQPSTLVPNSLRLQLDQGFDCGYGLTRKGVSSTICSFTANADPGNQWPFQGREGKGDQKALIWVLVVMVLWVEETMGPLHAPSESS